LLSADADRSEASRSGSTDAGSPAAGSIQATPVNAGAEGACLGVLVIHRDDRRILDVQSGAASRVQ
jgi:hypothetical protein